jgi:hypothetical protein
VFTARYELIHDTQFRSLPWLGGSFAILSPQRPGSNPRPVSVRFVVDNMALEQVFLQVLLFYPVSIIPPLLHTHLQLKGALITWTNGLSLEAFQKAMLFRRSGRSS